MEKRDEYRRHAGLCQRMADASPNERDRGEWLSLAQSWLEMIRLQKHIANEADFLAQHAPSGTGQHEARSSH
jgi:hypothetical protein